MAPEPLQRKIEHSPLGIAFVPKDVLNTTELANEGDLYSSTKEAYNVVKMGQGQNHLDLLRLVANCNEDDVEDEKGPVLVFICPDKNDDQFGYFLSIAKHDRGHGTHFRLHRSWVTRILRLPSVASEYNRFRSALNSNKAFCEALDAVVFHLMVYEFFWKMIWSSTSWTTNSKPNVTV